MNIKIQSERTSRFSETKQMVLLLSRKDYNSVVAEKIQNIILENRVDWNLFLGLVFNHRVNGVIFNRFTKMENVPVTVKRSLQFMLFSQIQRNACHKQEIAKIYMSWKKEKLIMLFSKEPF